MKSKIICSLMSISLLAMSLAACSRYDETTAKIEVETTLVSVSDSPDVVVSEAVDNDDTYKTSFSAYGKEYAITILGSNDGSALTVTAESDAKAPLEFDITAPDGYEPYVPLDAAHESDAGTVIRSDSSDIPDLIKIDFYQSEYNVVHPYAVSQIFTIKDDELIKFSVTSTVTGKLQEINYIPDTELLHTEPLKFMDEPVILQTQDGSLMSQVYVYVIDHDSMTINRIQEDCSMDNPLYYGYMMHSIATDIYKYFVTTCFEVNDQEYKIVNTDDGGEIYYAEVTDPRFSTVEELRSYISNYFAEDIVAEMVESAPQKYQDIDGKLYTILGDGGVNLDLGKLLITNWDIDGNVITYHTKQESYTDFKFNGYVDGGDFVVEVNNGSFKILKYRYPQSPV